jgi:hypothetical protein
MALRSNPLVNGLPFCLAAVAFAFAGCGNSHPVNDAATNASAPGAGGAASPVADDSGTCSQPTTPAPDLDPQPVRPCTEAGPNATTQLRYDATGRMIYRAKHSTYGPQSLDEVYTSEDTQDTRVETVTTNGRITERHVTKLKDGLPVEADHFQVSSDGVEQLSGHTTWNYDASGRQASVVTDTVGAAQKTETDSYDANGRLYFVDQTQRFSPSQGVAARNWTLRTWHANGSLAGEIQGCGDPAMAQAAHASCVVGDWRERRWDACGNLTYSAEETKTGRYSRWIDWSWDASGNPRTRHDRWTGAAYEWSSTESYTLDSSGRAASSSIVIKNPSDLAGSLPPTEEHRGSYAYDGNGHAIQRLIDGQSTFEARFDAAGRVLERDRHDGAGLFRWTYDGCGLAP